VESFISFSIKGFNHKFGKMLERIRETLEKCEFPPGSRYLGPFASNPTTFFVVQCIEESNGKFIFLTRHVCDLYYLYRFPESDDNLFPIFSTSCRSNVLQIARWNSTFWMKDPAFHDSA
jgi:hypothetical protein